MTSIANQIPLHPDARHAPLTATETALLPSTPGFILPLSGAPYMLQQEDLDALTPPPIRRSHNRFRQQIRLLQYQQQTVQLELKDGKELQVMTITVQPQQFLVHCSCNANQPCKHVYRGLSQVMWYTCTDYFEQFSPLGAADLARLHPQYFTLEKPWPAMDYKWLPKKQLGTVYQLSAGGKITVAPASIPFAANPHNTVHEKVLSFMVLTSFHQSRLPCIVPCVGLLNKAGDDIKQFLPFVQGLDKKEMALTADQQQLGSIGLAMLKLVETLPGRLCDTGEAQQAGLLELFELWQQALPALCLQPFFYSYQLPRARYQKSKPIKNYLRRCRIYRDRPQLQFVLKDLGDYFSFYPQLLIRNVVCNHYVTEHGLLVWVDDHCYLLASLKDAMLLQQLPPLTVFKEHYPQFEREVLAGLREYAISRC